MTEEQKNNMQDILSDIKNVISGNNDEPLELVNEVDKEGKPIATHQASTENTQSDKLTTETSLPPVLPEKKEENAVEVKQEIPVETPASTVNSEIKVPEEVKPSSSSSTMIDDLTTKALLSEKAIEESSQHFKELLKAVARPQDNFGLRSGVTVEDLVVEALKPQLSAWLDKNLPVLVKELVEKEIRRLIPEDKK